MHRPSARVLIFLAFCPALLLLPASRGRGADRSAPSWPGMSASAPAGHRDLRGGLSLPALLQRYGLELSTDFLSDRHELTRPGLRVVLVPGLPIVLVNGTRHAVGTPPLFSGGTLVISDEILRLFPAASERGAEIRTAVILDPGHGGQDPGAVGWGGVCEKDVNLQVALRVREILARRGIRVYLTRTGDTFPTLEERADFANRIPNSIFVSLHANAADDRNVSGIETFVLSRSVSDGYRTQQAASRYTVRTADGGLSAGGERRVLSRLCEKARGESQSLAYSIHRRLVAATREEDRGVRQENFHVLRENYFAPAVLVEMGFLTHPYTARRLSSSVYQRILAQAIAQGILDYIEKQSDSSPSAWRVASAEGNLPVGD
ncbi:MAG: N-acetylmuramoyl-L-alanine amidase [Planctomycetota bacterium]